MSDATFEDGVQKPLRLVAFEPADLDVISSLCQDAVFPAGEVSWRSKDRRFAVLLNRFRWEDANDAALRTRDYERVQSVLTVENAQRVRSQGMRRDEGDVVMSVLSLSFSQTESGGIVALTLAGDAVIEVTVEALEVTLRDVTRPYFAPSRAMPKHPD